MQSNYASFPSQSSTLQIKEFQSLKPSHFKPIKSLQFSKDGKKILSASLDESIVMWDIESKERILSILKAHLQGAKQAIFSHDEKSIISIGYDTPIKIWDIDTKQCINEIGSNQNSPNCMTLSYKGDRLAFSREDGLIQIIDPNTGQQSSSYKTQQDTICCLAFCHDDSKLASGSKRYSIKVWDFNTKSVIANLQGHRDKITSLTFSPTNSNQLISSSKDSKVKVWDISTKLCASIFDGSLYEVNQVVISPDGKKIIAGSYKALNVYNLNPKKCIGTLKTHHDQVNAIAYSLDGKKIVSGGVDQIIRLYNFDSKIRSTIPSIAYNRETKQVLVSPDGNLAYILLQGQKQIEVMSIKEFEVIKMIKADKEIESFELSSNGKFIVMLQNNYRVQSWDLEKEEKFIFSEEKYASFKISSNNKELFLFNRNGFSKWNIFSKQMINFLKLSSIEQPKSPLFFKNGRFFIQPIFYQSHFKIWDSVQLKTLKTIQASNNFKSSSIVSKCGQYVITLDKSSIITVRNIKTSKALSRRNTDFQDIVINDPSKKYFITGSNSSIQIWKIQSPQEVTSYQMPNCSSYSFLHCQGDMIVQKGNSGLIFLKSINEKRC